MPIITLRRGRAAANLVGAVCIATALGAGAAAMADAAMSTRPAPPTTPTAPAPSQTPPVTSQPAVPTAPHAHTAPVAAPEKPASKPAKPASEPTRLLNMRTAEPWGDMTFVVPKGLASCPAATVSWREGTGRATVKGVDYELRGDSNATYNDLTGDGHEELVMVVTCDGSRQAMLVLGANGPTTFATIAARDLAGIPSVTGLLRAPGAVTTVDRFWPPATATDERTWVLRGGRIVQASAVPKPVDWRNATLTVPAITSCPAGAYTFTDGRASGAGGELRTDQRNNVAFHADITGDGSRESILALDCVVAGKVAGSSVVALSRTGAKSGRVLGVALTAAARDGESVADGGVHFTDGIVSVSTTRIDADSGTRTDGGRDFRWSDGRFVPVS